MSCYEWEHGTIVLPNGQAPKIRAALTRAAEARIAALIAATDSAWAYIRTLTAKQRREGIMFYQHPALERLDEEAHGLLLVWDRNADGTGRSSYRKPSQKMIRERVVGRHKNARTGVVETVFHCGYEATITLAGNKVTWDVPENNHASERAREHPMAHALFGFLAHVPWTSRSGGEIVGNNEYNRDSRDSGGGGNFLVNEYSAASSRRQRELTASRYGRHW